MKKNWFYRMLFSYIPIFLSVCCTLLLLLLGTIRQLSEQSAVHSNETVANNATHMIEQMLSTIEAELLALARSGTITGFYVRPGQPDHTSSYEASLELANFRKRFPLVSSIYLVKPEERVVLESASLIALERHPDQDFIEAKLKEKGRYVWGDRRTIASSASPAAKRDVISLARISDYRTKGFVVAMVEADAIREQLSQFVNPSAGYLQIMDQGGAMIASTLMKEEYGEDRRNLAGVRMEYTGWTMESGVYQPGFLSWFEPSLYITIALSVFCMLAGLLWIIVATRKHYRPVQSLLRQIGVADLQHKPATRQRNNGRDEFQTIAHAIDNLSEQSDRLRKENEANRKLRLEHRFRCLAEGRLTPAAYNEANEDELFGRKNTLGQPTALLVEVDRYSALDTASCSESENQRLKHSLQTCLKQLLEASGIGCAAEWLSDRQLGAIVLQESVDRPDLPSRVKSESQKEHMSGETLTGLLEQFRSQSERELLFTVTIAVGITVERIEAVSISFQTARAALSRKLSLGGNRVISGYETLHAEHGGTAAELRKIEDISRLLRAGEPSWEEGIDEFFSTLRSGAHNGEHVRNLLFVLLLHIQHKMSDLSGEMELAWRIASKQIEDSINGGETLEDIGIVVKETLKAEAVRMREWLESKNSRLVLHDVKRYIDEHYADPSLSQSMLAEVFGLHPSALSRWFKEQYGVKFVDYVNAVRVEQAVRLMDQSGSTVQEIAIQVGFVHSTTFISSFKKVTGFTPGSYQKRSLGEEARG